MRKRFNRERLCSSDNYEASQRIHRKHLQELHNNQIDKVEVFMETHYVKRMYVKVFGKEIQIQESELHYYEGFTIYYK